MKAAELAHGTLRLQADYPRPEPAEGEALVRVLRAGICETDLQLMQGYMGFEGVLGHEFVGIAETGPLAGKRVVGEINCSCRTCEFCRQGLENHCPHRSVLGILNRDGAFAEYVSLPEGNLHPVPEDIPTDDAVFTEPLAAAFQIPAQLSLTDKQHVIVLGDGRLGNLCAQVIRLQGCRLTVIGKHEPKLAVLRELGIETARLDEVAPERFADVVVDCTGSPTGLPTALQFVKPRGTIVLKTTVAGEQRLPISQLVIDEMTLIGSRCGPFDRALDALKAGDVEVALLLSARFPLAHARDALERAATSDTLKILLDVGRE